MQTAILQKYLDTPEGREADAILRACVHCGFCTATCPTYQLLGDELDGPRGRIYLIKQVLEGRTATRRTQLHLDRCLTCRACETTCPSGVRYARLTDIGRELIERQVGRRLSEKALRRTLRAVLPYPARFTPLLRIGQTIRTLLPDRLRRQVPPQRPAGDWPASGHSRRMLVLEGCVQRAATPDTNAMAARVLDRLGVSLIRARRAGCCGAMSHHLSATEESFGFMRRNVDAWWPHIEAGAEAVVITASGCGAVVKDYGELLKHDQRYAAKAEKVSALARDLCEVLAHEDLGKFRGIGRGRRIAFHSPCSLQHAQKLTGVVEGILAEAGFDLVRVADSHLCCGSAGTYSLLQPKLSEELLRNKVAGLTSAGPERIVTANIGCQLHLAGAAKVPVEHWISLLAEPWQPLASTG